MPGDVTDNLPDNLPKTLLGRVGFGALLLALALAPMMGGYPAGPTYGGDVFLGALRCLVLVAALLCILAERPTMPRSPENRFRTTLEMALWLAVALTGISLLAQSRFLTSPVLLFASLPGAIDWFCYGLLFSLAMRFGQGRAVFWLVGAVLVGAGIAGIFSVQEYGQFVQAGEPQRRAQGLFFSPNFAGGLMALLLPVVIAACVATQQRLMSLVLGALAAMMAGALFASGSRASIAFTVVGLLVALGFSLTKLRRLPGAVARIAALAAVLLILAFAFRGPLVQRVAAAGQEQSGPFRTWTWKGTFAMAKAHPLLGAGPGTFPFVYPHYALVGRTDLAHSSYLQMAAEEGFPALIIAAGVLAAVVLLAGWELLRAVRSSDAAPLLCLLKAGLLGGLLAGLARSVFDSEWSIVGDAYAFWTVAGLALMPVLSSELTATPETSAKPAGRSLDSRLVIAPGLAILLILSLLCLKTASMRSAALAQMQHGDHVSADDAGWPPDPQLLALAEKPEEAARIEPTGKRWYQLGLYKLRQNDLAGAIAALKESVAVEPISLQSWRRLAETQEQAGDAAGALQSWQKLVDQQEGPVGTIRAIPEMTETHAAFAYAALARDAARRGNISEAATLYEKAASVVESYAHTPSLYQQMEVSTAQISGANVQTRRAEVRTLYQTVMDEWAGLQKEKAAELASRRDQTLSLLDKMAAPAQVPTS